MKEDYTKLDGEMKALLKEDGKTLKDSNNQTLYDNLKKEVE